MAAARVFEAQLLVNGGSLSLSLIASMFHCKAAEDRNSLNNAWRLEARIHNDPSLVIEEAPSL